MLPISSTSNPFSPLQLSIEAQAWSEVEKAMLVKGMSPEQIASFQNLPNALNAAVHLNDLDLCKKILNLGYPINRPNENIATSALSPAIFFGYNDIAIFLIDNGADLTLQDDVMGTYLHLAIGRENLTLAEVLLKHNTVLLNQEVVFSNPHASWPLDSYSGGPFKMPATMNVSPLHFALVLPNTLQGEKMAAFLIQQGAYINTTSSIGFNYLHLAAYRGYPEICKLLINKGINIDSVCCFTTDIGVEFQMTPLSYAVRNQHLSTTKTLLELNASFQIGTNAANAFEIAINSGKEEWIQCFLDKGAAIDQINQFGHRNEPELFQILAFQKAETRMDLLQLLIKLGLNIYHRMDDQSTYLHHAAKMNDKKICEFLISQGLNVNALDDKQRNALYYTVDPQIISLLLQKGADARCINGDIYTPLMSFDQRSFSKEHLELKAADKDLTALIQKLKQLGLRHSLPGKAFEASKSSLTYPDLADSLESFLKQQSEIPSFIYQLPSILKLSNTPSYEDVVQKINEGKIVSIAAGWYKHGISIVCSKEYLIIGNRGDHAGEDPGLQIFKVKNPDHLPEAIKKIIAIRDFKIDAKVLNQRKSKDFKNLSFEDLQEQIQQETKKGHVDYLTKEIMQELDLERVFYLPLKNQITGTCALEAPKMALRSLLFLHYRKENPALSFDDIKPLVKKFYSAWSKFDLSNNYLDILAQAEAEPLLTKHINYEEVYDELLAANFFKEEICNKLFTLRPQLIEKKNSPDSKMLALAYKRQHHKLLQWLLDKSVDVILPKFLYDRKPEIDELLMFHFIKKGPEIHFQDAEGYSPLAYFCMKKNKAWSLKLLQAWKCQSDDPSVLESLKKAVNILNKQGLTPMHYLIATSDNLESIKEHINLFLQCGLDWTTPRGYNTLILALQKIKSPKDLEIFKSILEACSDKETNVNLLFENETLLEQAFKSKEFSEPISQLLLEHGAILTFTPSTLKFYAEKGLTLDLKDSDGLSLLNHLCRLVDRSKAIEPLKAWKQQCEETNNLELLKQKVNAADKNGNTPLITLLLHCETLEEIKAILALLIECGAEANYETPQGYSVLLYALVSIKSPKDIEIFKSLLNACPDKQLNLNKQHIDGITLLDQALDLKEHSQTVTQLLLAHGAHIQNEHVKWFNVQNINPVLLKYYTQNGLQIDIKDSDEATPLHYLSIFADKSMALNLLKAWKQQCEATNKFELLRQKVNAPNKDGFSPFMRLFLHADTLAEIEDIVPAFLECGTDLTLESLKGNTGLFFALLAIKSPKDVEIFKTLLNACPDKEQILNKLNHNGETLLDRALDVKEYSAPVTQLLLEHGAQLKDEHVKWFTMNHINPVLLQYYAQTGLQIDIKDSDGATPLHHLCTYTDKSMALKVLKAWKQQYEQTNSLELLKQKVNAPSNNGYNLLHGLFFTEQPLEETKDLLAFLMECGADVSASYDRDVTPLYYAVKKVKKSCDLKILEMLFKNPEQVNKALNPLNQTHKSPLYIIDPNTECSYTLAKLLIDHGAIVYTNDQGIIFPDILVKYPDLYQYYQERRKKQQ